jgi:hypothetical protein
MKKTDKKPSVDAWDLDPETGSTVDIMPEDDVTPSGLTPPEPETRQPARIEFDMDGLMTDFPNATELQRFVYDQTGIVLNLKGRANKLKYQIAMDTLNGNIPDEAYLGAENPYLDKSELIPTEPLRELPPRDALIDQSGPEVTRFSTNQFPHPDPDWRAQDQKCQVIFRKYANNLITYEVLGPIAQRAIGTKINKFGQKQPERIIWIDCRTGEQIIRNDRGQLTPLGTRLKGFMSRMKVNRSNQWDIWIDRDFILAGDLVSDNPWGE